MKFVTALQKGIELVGRHKRFIILAWLVNVALILIPGLLVINTIQDSLSGSGMSEVLVSGYNEDWYREFSAQAQGLAESFDPTVTGPGALLNSLDGFLRGDLFRESLPIVGLGAGYLLIWLFFSAGFLTSFQSGSTGDFGEFFAGAGRYLGRFFRLGLIALALFGLVYAGTRWLDGVLAELTRETVDERVAFVAALVKYGVFLSALFAVRLWIDYTRVILVAEHRRSAFLALIRSFRFAWTNRGQVALLGGSLLAFFLAVSMLYGVSAPGADSGTVGILILGLVLAQAFIIARIVIRVLGLSSQWELFGMLAASASPEPPRTAGTGPAKPTDGLI